MSISIFMAKLLNTPHLIKKLGHPKLENFHKLLHKLQKVKLKF